MRSSRSHGFTLIELLITVAIISILGAIALPSYRASIVKGSRAAVQTELLNLASVQEKIYLNSGEYSPNLTTAYTGNSSGGLGSTGQSKDGKYNFGIDIVAVSQTYQITATPVTGSTQAGDGNITIRENGEKLWKGTVAW